VLKPGWPSSEALPMILIDQAILFRDSPLSGSPRQCVIAAHPTLT
jgi:hypothetical protein